MDMTKKDWVLLVLKQNPMDRIHIMKSLFLIWHRSERKLSDYFYFEPYLYGPCSFEVYSELENLSDDGLIIQPPYQKSRWVHYYLTEKGKRETVLAEKKASPILLKIVDNIKQDISQLNFHDLLREIYQEAPDFAVNSMFKGVFK